MRIQGLLFDLDGTLVDSHAEICRALATALTELEISLPFKEVEALVDGSPLEIIWDKLHKAGLTLASERGFRRFADCYRDHYMRDLGRHSALFPGVSAALAEIHRLPQRPGCAVVSNKAAASVSPLLERLGVAHFFDVALGCGGTATRPKPAPDLLLEAARKLARTQQHCAMVGDTVLDVEAAKRADMLAVAVAHGMGERAALVSAGADYVFDDFEELARFLRANL
jgi:phosphoglycolate phosphatase